MKESKAKAQVVYVMIWGGGDEPESPAISVHRTMNGAIAAACENLQGISNAKEIGRVRRELKAEGTVYGISGTRDSWINVEEHCVT